MKSVLTLFLHVAITSAAFAGFASNEVYLASIGRGGGAGGAQFYSTLWVTNLSSSATVHFTFFFLKDGQSNLTGDPSFNDMLAPGQTKLYEDVTETKLNLPGQFGAARITADGEIFASERVYNLAHSTDNLGTSEGLFFAAVPKSFAIGLGDTASIQGVNQGSPTEDMRTNFDLVETTGNTCQVHVTLLDQNGTSQGATDVNMNPYGHVKLNAQALLHSVDTINGRIVATVTSGSGQVILAGEQLANTSQDSSGFEMSFKDSLITGNTGNCGVCVTSVNGLSGAVTIAAGSNVTLGKSGQTITITGSGLTLPFTGSSSGSQTTFAVSNTGNGTGIQGEAGSGSAVVGVSGSGSAVVGESSSGIGVYGQGNGTTQSGVYGTNPTGYGVEGDVNNDQAGVAGINTGGGGGAGVYGQSDSGVGIFGKTAAFNTAGVKGISPGYGVEGATDAGIGVYGITSTTGTGVKGESDGGDGVYGITGSNSHYGVHGISVDASGITTGSAGVWGDSATGPGVIGTTGGTGIAVYGYAPNNGTAVYGQSTAGHYGVYSNGDFGGTGAKYFVEPHPTDASKEIRYICLEGPEAGTYFRGTARVVNGFATIDVPDHFRMVSSAAGLTVQVTPMGEFAALVCVRKDLNQIVIKGSADVEFDYVVNGIRKAFPAFQPISENKDFVPKSPSDDLGITALPAESVRRLKASGILDSDGSINLETAHRLGWDQRPGWNEKAKIEKESK